MNETPTALTQQWTVWIHRANILTNNDRKHHHDKGLKAAKQVLKALGAEQARKVGRLARARMDVEVAYPPKIYLDAANLQATLKVYVDAMTSPKGKRDPAAGFLQDDSDKFFTGPFITWAGWPSGREGWFCFRITLTELEPWSKPDRPDWLG